MAAQSFLDLVGNTPLIKLRAASELTGCEIYGKAEFSNPGGSVKDRAAKAIIQAAEASGSLRKGGTIIEGTAGNTGLPVKNVTERAAALTLKLFVTNDSDWRSVVSDAAHARAGRDDKVLELIDLFCGVCR